MSQELTKIMPKILARGLMALRERCVMPRVVNSDYGTDAQQRGATVDVPVPTKVSTIDVSPSNTPPSAGDHTPDIVQIALDNWKQNSPIHLTDKELTQIDANAAFLPMQMSEAIKALASDVNVSILEKYKKIYGYTGTAGTTPFGSNVGDATNARKLLNKQLAPRTDRNGVLDFDAEANALNLSAFSDAEKVGSADVKLEGEIGRKFGILWLSDDDILTHVAGTIETNDNERECAVDNGAGYDAGDDTINVDEGAATSVTGTIKVGDVIEFAGHDQTYTVVNNDDGSSQATGGVYTFASNAIENLKISPALKEDVADDEVIEVMDDHVVNLAFHRDAFAFANRPLLDATAQFTQGLGGQQMTMQDPVTGLVLRLEVSRQHKQIAWEFDILWGAELVRPELAVRIAG